MESIGKTIKKVMNKLGGKITPVTGVFTTNRYAWLIEDSAEAVDLGYEEFLAEKGEEDDTYEDNGSGTYLIGFKKNEKGEFEPDPKEEYSAIMNGNLGTTQVVRSNYGIMCNKCSPCYPGQGDAETKGDDYIAYSLPPDVIKDSDVENEKLADRVFKLDKNLFNLEG